MNLTDEPFIELIAPRPGTLSIRSGRLGILEYEHGYILESPTASYYSEAAQSAKVWRALRALRRS